MRIKGDRLIKAKVSKFLDEYKLWDKILLVGFSGGFDSMCLLDILYNISKERPLKIAALHYNHNWRGEKARQEQEFCRDYCEKRQIEFYTETALDDIKKNETEARELRYNFFERARDKYKDLYPDKDVVVLTAHNWDDNAETILYRIIKGTGIVGLKGILPNRDNYYRPIINIERKDIEKYCSDNSLFPNNDESNDDRIHNRNLIRHDILPLLAKINPDIKKSLNSLGAIATSESEIIDEYMSKLEAKLFDNGVIKTAVYKELSNPVKQKVIYNLIYNSEFDYTMDTVLGVCEFIEKSLSENKPSKYSLGKDGWVYADSNIINIISSGKKYDNVIKLTENKTYMFAEKEFTIESAAEYCQTNSESDVYVDLSRFSDLYIRTRRDGDVIQPLGSNGRMKLKKYFMSKKIPQYERDGIILLTDGIEILWVAGVGMSEKIKVTDKPTHRLTVTN